MSFYRQTITPLVKYLKTLSELLDKGVKFADTRGMQHEEILNFKLAPDMKPLTYQVICCCNGAKYLPARLGLVADMRFEDDETTFDQLQARISKTIDILGTVEESKMEGRERQAVVMDVKNGPFKFETGQAYVSDFALPFFHFHYATAYCILRQMGVEIGAMDYFGRDTFVKVEP